MKNQIKNTILEYISKNKDELYFHGTSNIGHDNFNKNHINYFTKDYNYALNYTHPSYSAIAGKKEDNIRGIYVVKLNCNNVFNTRDNSSHYEIFQDYTNTYGNRTPIGDLGFPDWTDTERLVDYFEDKKYNFDCIILHDAHSVISYATIGKDKVEIVDRIII